MEIRLRKITENDLETIMNWRMKPSVTKFMITDPDLTLSAQKEWFKKINNDKTRRNFMITAKGVRIGVIYIVDIDYQNKRCSLDWYIGEDEYRGRGIAKKVQLNLFDYVFYELKLHRLWGHALAFNEHALDRVYVPLGYEIEGVMKDHVRKNGEFMDVAIFGITVDKWEEIRDSFNYEKISFPVCDDK